MPPNVFFWTVVFEVDSLVVGTFRVRVTVGARVTVDFAGLLPIDLVGLLPLGPAPPLDLQYKQRAWSLNVQDNTLHSGMRMHVLINTHMEKANKQ